MPLSVPESLRQALEEMTNGNLEKARDFLIRVCLIELMAPKQCQYESISYCDSFCSDSEGRVNNTQTAAEPRPLVRSVSSTSMVCISPPSPTTSFQQTTMYLIYKLAKLYRNEAATQKSRDKLYKAKLLVGIIHAKRSRRTVDAGRCPKRRRSDRRVHFSQQEEPPHCTSPVEKII